MTSLIGINPWDQQPGEATKAFEAFRTYRDLGPGRSHRVAFTKLTGKDNSRGRFDVWSAQNDWVKRVEAYDRWMDQNYTNKMAEEVKEMAERHAKMAVVFLNKVVERLQKIDPHTLTADQLLRWFDTCTRIERMSRGEATENVKTEHTETRKVQVDLTKLSNDDFDQVHRIFTRATESRSIGAGVIEAEARVSD